MRVDNVSDSSQIHGMDRHSTSMIKGIAMLSLPYRTLIQYKRWATNGLNGVVAENLERVPADDRVLVRRLLDHVQTVDAGDQIVDVGSIAPRAPETFVGGGHRPQQRLNHLRDGQPSLARPDEHGRDGC